MADDVSRWSQDGPAMAHFGASCLPMILQLLRHCLSSLCFLRYIISACLSLLCIWSAFVLPLICIPFALHTRGGVSSSYHRKLEDIEGIWERQCMGQMQQGCYLAWCLGVKKHKEAILKQLKNMLKPRRLKPFQMHSIGVQKTLKNHYLHVNNWFEGF